MKTRMFAINWAAVLALITVGAAASAHAQKYAIAAIPAPPGIAGPCNPAAVNDRGQAVGWIGQSGYARPFLYDPSTGTRLLPTLTGDYYGEALDINHTGEVVGYCWDGGYGFSGFVWDSVNGTRPIDQIADSNGTTAASLGWSITEASDINTEGDILVFGNKGVGIWRMTTANGMSTVSVQSVPLNYNSGKEPRLNDHGIVLFPQTSDAGAPALWDSSSLALTYINPANGTGIALNNNGDVVGYSWFSDGSAVTYLGSLVAGGYSSPYGINDLNQVVGTSGVGYPGSAYIWQNGVMQDLNNLTAGTTGKNWLLSWPFAISNPANKKHTAGYIVGVGFHYSTMTAWIATPQ